MSSTPSTAGASAGPVFEFSGAGAEERWVTALFVLAALAPFAAATALKGKWATFAAGFFVPIAWGAGAIRLAKPRSRWARRVYRGKKQASAERRAVDRTQLAVALSAFLLAAFVSALLIVSAKAYIVPSSAMEPTLRCAKPHPGCSAEASDRVLALRYVLGREPARGDVVAFRSNAAFEARCGSRGVFLRRVVALPGDLVEASAGVVSVNGRVLDEADARFEPRASHAAASGNYGPVRMPRGHYFLLGDLRGASCDGFVSGPAPREHVIAEVVAVYWPPSRIGRR